MDIIDSLQNLREEAKKFSAKEMGFGEYLSLPYFSSTKIKRYSDNPEDWKDESIFSKEKLFGSVLHKALSEPEEFDQNKEVFTSMLPKRDQEIFSKCLFNFYGKSYLKRLIADPLHMEKTFVFDFPVGEKKYKCKVRPDLVTKSGWLVDFKTTCKDLRQFEWEIKKYRYDIQLAFYLAGLKANGITCKGAFLLAIEKVAPYGNHLFVISKSTLGKADYEWRESLTEMIVKPKKSRFEEEFTEF